MVGSPTHLSVSRQPFSNNKKRDFLKNFLNMLRVTWQINSNTTQYHGGTNLGGFGSSHVTTSYYDEAPLDEYGKGMNAILQNIHFHRIHNISMRNMIRAHMAVEICPFEGPSRINQVNF